MADYVPALKAKMGDWQYYVTAMKMGKIARECRLAEEIHANKDLDDLIQRAIQDRVKKEMVPYLLNEPQRFYGALVVAVYGGAPEFAPVTVSEHELLDDKDSSYSYGFGLLRFDGSQIYYALDGQHRLKSIQEAIQTNPDLAQEEICVIILKHENSREGLERTRRLFSTLNRRAKPTTSGMNIAIDEDDAVAIVTRRLVKENSLIKSLVLTTLGTKKIAPSKSHDAYITTLSAFYETNEILLTAYDGGLEIDKQFRPCNDDLERYYNFLAKIWELLLQNCPNFKLILEGRKKPGEIRKRTDEFGSTLINETGKPIAGGNVFARPIGQFIIAEVIRIALLQRYELESIVKAIMENISMDIDDEPWAGVIWNSSTQNIKGNKQDRKIIVDMICHALGLRIKTKISDLKQRYRDTLEDPKASLLKPIEWSGRRLENSDESIDNDEINTSEV